MNQWTLILLLFGLCSVDGCMFQRPMHRLYECNDLGCVVWMDVCSKGLCIGSMNVMEAELANLFNKECKFVVLFLLHFFIIVVYL
jgi:hypothetical protein